MNAPQPNVVPPARKTVDRIPVSLLTGFLGAGKTTLLNHLTKCPELAGTALLINEFGEIGIDHHLVERIDETLVLLDSGCLCCSVQGDLVNALKQLSQRSSRREIPPVTRVIIETTGLADPVPVIYTLMEESFVAARYVCDSVLTAVDATHALSQLTRHREAMRQVSMADRLIITKCDLADAASRAALHARLDLLNPSAIRLEVRNGQVDPAALFGSGIYSPASRLPDVAAWLGEERVRDQRAREAAAAAPLQWRKPGARTHAPAPAHRHDEAVSSFVVGFGEPVSWYGFAVAMGRILQAHGANILRIKGLLNVAGDDRPHVVHCVQDIAYPTVRLAAWPAQSPFEDRKGRLVFIVDGLANSDIDAIRISLANLPTDATALRISASTPLLPTKCWLAQRAPTAGADDIRLDGWIVQKKRLASR